MKLTMITFVLGAATMFAQFPGRQITYSEPSISAYAFSGSATGGPLIGTQFAGCTDGAYAYNLGIYSQVGWS